MAGIVRVRIESDWNDWRTEMALDLASVADEIYRAEFSKIGMPLQPGLEEVICTKDEAVARYDWQEGIDVIFNHESCVRSTCQEKFLTYPKSTITYEERKTSGALGAWYYCTAQYYFVGYARKWREDRIAEFQDYMMIDNPAIHRLTAQNEITWLFNRNRHDGRRAIFRYIYFDDVPETCVVFRREAIVQQYLFRAV